MRYRWMLLVGLGLLAACGQAPDQDAKPTESAASGYERLEGFVDLLWDADEGRLFIEVGAIDEPFIYQSSLPRGVGSNDLGLDRGQLGATRIVRFERSGPRLLLIEDNLDYRAVSDDATERRAVTESFARSVVWGFDIVEETADGVLVDGTAFFLRDAHGLAARLSALEEGSYSTDASRSAIYLPRTKAFPDNTEIEAIVTFTGQPTGQHLPTVVPDATAVSVHMHHSFVRLPDDGYEPLPYDPRIGVIGLGWGSPGFADYATPIGESLYVNYGIRHRLEKQNPDAEVSEAVEPIVYYLDPGAPEPVRSALLEGALWWNEAFEAAGYKDAFQVRMLPEDADPMDVRYNVIQWVHRSTRGWSYGMSVMDPRTGEIIKGHVTLGSLRVRQDYMIVEGLLSPYAGNDVPDTMLEVALARIRQLSAHEIGHTIGFLHNFAASTQDRASVMDYPFPLVTFDADGNLDFSQAYDTGIGTWDIRTVLYAYQDFPEGVDADAARRQIVEETIAQGFKYVADADGRAIGTPHPDGNVWDNGSDALVELEHLLALRAHALERFSVENIRNDRPLATLEEVLVPVYLLHRFQLSAVGKLLGGAYFDYALRGDGRESITPVTESRQRQALAALLATLDPGLLRLPDGLAEQILPRPPGHPQTREMFTRRTGSLFDPLAPAAAAVTLTLDVLLEPTRAARLQRSRNPGFDAVTNDLLNQTWFAARRGSIDGAIQRQTNDLVLTRLQRLAGDVTADAEVRGLALVAVDRLDGWIGTQAPRDAAWAAHYAQAAWQIERWRRDPAVLDALPATTAPPGSPIGAAGE